MGAPAPPRADTRRRSLSVNGRQPRGFACEGAGATHGRTQLKTAISTTTQKKGRFLHGQDGRGRFKAFALGQIAEWGVACQKAKKFSRFTVTMTATKLKEVLISDEEETDNVRHTGVTLTISELYKDYRSLTSPTGLQELAEILALYLADYKDVAVFVDGNRIDPSSFYKVYLLMKPKTPPLMP